MRYFKGEIDGKKLNDFNKLDYINIQNIKDRLKCVEELTDNSFFTTYFDEYYNASPNRSGELAEGDSVCRLLEMMGTYLIESKDVKSNRKVEYRFWTDEREYRKSMESENVTTSLLQKGIGEDNDVEIIDMFVNRKKDKNQKIVKPISINKKDIKEIGEIGELQKAIDYIKSPLGIKTIKENANHLLENGYGNEEERAKLRYIAKNTERYVKAYANTLKENQVLIKRAIKRPIEFKNLLKDAGFPNKLDAFDFMQKRDIKAILPFLHNEDLMTDLGIIVYDVNQLLNETKLSSNEHKLIELFRKGYSKSEATRALGVKSETTNKMMNRISLKAVKTYENKLEKYRESKRLKKN